MITSIKLDSQLRFTAETFRPFSEVELRNLSKTWGGSGTWRKTGCIKYILDSLAQPERIRERLSILPEMDIAALWILREQGGVMRAGDLEWILRCYGYNPSGGTTLGYNRCVYVPQLIQNGLLLWDQEDYFFSLNSRSISSHTLVWIDGRITDELMGPPTIVPLNAHPLQAPADAAVYRRPSHVLMDCLAITRALQQMQGLRLTQQGTVRVADVRQFAKLLGWEKGATYAGFTFPNIVEVVLAIWTRCHWLVKGDGEVKLTITPEYFNSKPFEEIVSLMMGSYLARPRVTYPHSDIIYTGEEATLPVGLVYCMRALPEMARTYATSHFAAAAYQRIGDYTMRLRPYYQQRPGLAEKDADAEAKKQWLTIADTLCTEMLTGWMYWLGLVALQQESSEGLIFRFTEFGQRIMGYGVRAKAANKAAETAGPAWVVQPNFDVIVYLDNVTPEQLAFLETHGERRQMEMHTARYVLTRESIHHGMDTGTSLKDVIAALRAGASAALPQNVEREIRSWAELRERITVHPACRIIAFETSRERDRALQAGLQGRLLGDLYVLAPRELELEALLQGVFSAKRPSILLYDYVQKPLPNLRLGEDGTVVWAEDSADLLLPGLLERCTENLADKRMITSQALKRVKQAGISASAFLTFLQERSMNGVPGLLEMMIRHTMGTRKVKAEGMQAYVLRVKDKRLYEALTTSRTLTDYILDVPGPDTLLIKPERVAEFRKVLEELGVYLEGYGIIDERPDWSEVMKYAKQYMRFRSSRWDD